MIWAIAVVAAAAQPACYKDDASTPVIMRCALCPHTAGVLASVHTVWYTGGYNGTASVPNSPRSCVLQNGSIGKIIVGTGATITRGAANVAITSVEIRGGSVIVSDVTVTAGVSITGPVATSIKISTVAVGDPFAGVRVFNPSPASAVLDVSGLTVSDVTPTTPPPDNTHWAAVALAHTTGSAITITCSDSSHIVVTQPAGPQPAFDVVGCNHTVDLSEMLNVFGTRYEVMFEHWDYIPEAGGYMYWLWRLIAINVALAIMVAMCATAKAPAAKDKQE